MYGTKSQIATGGKETFTLGGDRVEVVRDYKYLGCEMSGLIGRGGAVIDRLVRTARYKASDLSGPCGCRYRGVHIAKSMKLWEAYARPVIEYAAEVWRPDANQAKKLEATVCDFARHGLGVDARCGNDFLLTELGLVSPAARREELKLRFFRHLCMAEADRALSKVFRYRCEQVKDGYSFAVLCRACGEKMQCENCAIALTHHKPIIPDDPRAAVASPSGQRLKCHYCGYVKTVPKRCPKCESEHLFYLGAGSQQGEERLQELFPQARIGRMDRDTIRNRFDMEHLLERLHSGHINLLVGTQMIAKGHDIHGVTFVGVVGADHALGLPDFRAAERVFQLLTQVSGRAGRGDLPGNVLVQSYYPEHYAIQCAAQHDFRAFVKKEMQYRKWMHYPPHAVLANIIIQSPRLEEAAGWAAKLGKCFAAMPQEQVRVLGPASAPIVRIKRIYRFHLLLKAAQRQALARMLRAGLEQAEALGIPRRSLIIDVDAVNLM